MVENFIVQDPRYNYVFCYTDTTMPADSVVKINNVNAPTSRVYTSGNGWNPGVGNSSLGVIGFSYNTNSFVFGGNFQISNSTGVINVSSYAGVVSGLVLYLNAGFSPSYPGSGSTWTDVSGNSNNGTLVNGPTFNSANGGYLTFDGVDDYVNTANTAGLNFTNTTGTISIWFRTSASTANSPMLITKQMDAAGGWAVVIAPNGIPYFETKNSGGGATAFYKYVNKACNDGIWHNFVAVFTTSTTVTANNTASMYLDGVLANGPQFNITIYGGNTAGTVQIGRRSSGNYFNGNISNVQIYNRGITAGEVAQNFNALKSIYGL